MAKQYMIGNWKMNQDLNEIKSFFEGLNLSNNQNNFWIAPQNIHISKSIELGMPKGVLIGSQNCSDQDNGAFTGENGTDALMEIGAHFSLVGHSERRSLFGESDALINKKISKAMNAGLVPVFCFGETLEQRESGKTFDIVLGQIREGLKGIDLNNEAELILAYEPIWAIGTGKTASPEQAQEVHGKIRELLVELYAEIGKDISILYGGSVKPSNINELLAQTDIAGGLVGGASLKAESFNDLCNALN